MMFHLSRFPLSGERKTSFQFTIHTESTWNKRMDWILAAQSEREMKEWILAFKVSLLMFSLSLSLSLSFPPSVSPLSNCLEHNNLANTISIIIQLAGQKNMSPAISDNEGDSSS